MKFLAIIALILLPSAPAFSQDQSSCKAYFQVLRATADSPGLTIGMDSSQKRWWDTVGQKQYPELCLNGSITSGDKPRYLVIWSKSKSIGAANLPADEVFGQSADALAGTAPAAWIYQPRWDVGSVTIVSVLYDGSTQTPPVYFTPSDRALKGIVPDTRHVLESAVRYLAAPWHPSAAGQ